MLVQVTPQDIAGGCRKEAESCPVARAVARAAGSPWVWVSQRFIRVFACEKDRDAWDWALEWGAIPSGGWDTPGQVADIITLYDATGLMEPFAFEL
jgi:hypothetical protein